jgi:cyclin H
MPTEDDIYRSSSQYRLWNFTPTRLASLRAKTNELARHHVRAALKRKRGSTQQPVKAENGSTEKTAADADENKDIDYLTVDEETTLVNFFCIQLMAMAELKVFALPTNVTVS